jgi:hypothetical protein
LQNKQLHIVSFNIPFPANYGGVIDVFYRIKALSTAGVKIHLHCFQYDRNEADELNGFCETVNYYKRSRSYIHQFSQIPFIVKTRQSKDLLQNLLNDEYPILFEGLHSCYWLDHPKLKNRKKIVRSHNIEHNYYRGLSLKTNNWKEKIYFKLEAIKLHKYEEKLKYAQYIAAISKADEEYLQGKYGNTFLMSPNHPSEVVESKLGRGTYILYHADLSVQENIEASLFILNELIPHVNAKIVFAGKNPSTEIKNKIEGFEQVELISNPDHKLMQQLVGNAHINLLPTFQATGFKLKLLNALFNGRFCVGTPQLVEGTGVKDACVIVTEPAEFIQTINTLLEQDYTLGMRAKRKALLKTYSNSAVVFKLIELLN